MKLQRINEEGFQKEKKNKPQHKKVPNTWLQPQGPSPWLYTPLVLPGCSACSGPTHAGLACAERAGQEGSAFQIEPGAGMTEVWQSSLCSTDHSSQSRSPVAPDASTCCAQHGTSPPPHNPKPALKLPSCSACQPLLARRIWGALGARGRSPGTPAVEL